MSKGINKFIGIGNCCADPDTRYAPSGAAITNVSIACNDSYKDKATGQVVDKTEFVRVVFFNRLAEIAGEYLRKGSKCYIEGKLQTRKWQDNKGEDRYTTEIIASELQMLDSKDDKPAQQAQPAQRQQAAPQPPMDAFDDDSIPF
jgi:single-strand DNA-binding protein